jgi:decaprenyl-phosphate phosphoribosyltransferase
MIRGLLREARPKQWVKNLLVFTAPGAAGVLDQPRQLGLTLLMFLAFCMAASGTYFWNDILDVEADRAHPTKCRRPIASGAVPIGTARVAGVVLLAGGIALSTASGRWQTVAILVVYVLTTLMYSAWLKHVAVIDLVIIASGFVLRAAIGASAVEVKMSSWFVLCVTFGSLFIVTGKRYAEMREMGEQAATTRASLDEYTPGFLRMVLSVSLGAALVSYCLWAFETKEVSGTDLPFYELSIPPMLTALLRYALVLEQGHGSAPEEIFAHDRMLQLLGVGWVVVFGLGVYLS